MQIQHFQSESLTPANGGDEEQDEQDDGSTPAQVETRCRWVGCTRGDLGSQEELVKVIINCLIHFFINIFRLKKEVFNYKF